MIPSDKPRFLRTMTTLAVALREPAPDTVQLRVYFDGLETFEIEYVEFAAERLMRANAWFPKLSEWLAACIQVQRERVEHQRNLLRRLPAPLCAWCSDTSWKPDVDGRVRPCDCRELRRQELLGRAPWPMLPTPGETP